MGELSLPLQEKISANEVALATKLIEGMEGKFDPAKYRDTYSEKVKTDRGQGPRPKRFSQPP